MRTVKKSVFFVVQFVVLSAIATFGVWYFFGKITVAATFEGVKMPDASVQVDDVVVCKKTPCDFRPIPGHHTVTIYPPEDYETAERVVTYEMFSGNLGDTIKADFHALQ